MTQSKDIIHLADKVAAPTYKPLPIVVDEAEGVWVKDPEGNKYLDMLSAYSAVNQGHRHPKIIKALKEQADKVTLGSRAFYSSNLGEWLDKLNEISGKEMGIPMNTGAEAVESAIKAARRWGKEVKGIEDGKQEIIGMKGNFHGRTLGAISLSSEASYKEGFHPLVPGFPLVPYGDIDALKSAINENTVAIILEPIQGESGINIPRDGFLKEIRELCDENNVLMIADEIQCGLGRSGKLFACDWEDVEPDMYILGKALGGGVLPVSVVLGDKEVLELMTPGSHGSTFGGNPLSAAVSIAAIDVLLDEKLADRSNELGEYMKSELQTIANPVIKEVRGRGLFIGMELTEDARPYCEALKERGLLCKETHDTVIRFAPPLIIEKEDLDWAIGQIKEVLSK